MGEFPNEYGKGNAEDLRNFFVTSARWLLLFGACWIILLQQAEWMTTCFEEIRLQIMIPGLECMSGYRVRRTRNLTGF